MDSILHPSVHLSPHSPPRITRELIIALQKYCATLLCSHTWTHPWVSSTLGFTALSTLFPAFLSILPALCQPTSCSHTPSRLFFLPPTRLHVVSVSPLSLSPRLQFYVCFCCGGVSLPPPPPPPHHTPKCCCHHKAAQLSLLQLLCSGARCIFKQSIKF